MISKPPHYFESEFICKTAKSDPADNKTENKTLKYALKLLSMISKPPDY